MNNLNFINLSKASLCESEEILIGLKDKKQKKINKPKPKPLRLG